MTGRLSFTNNDDTQKVYNYICQGCNILRGPIYPEEYKTHIFPLLFISGFAMSSLVSTQRHLN